MSYTKNIKSADLDNLTTTLYASWRVKFKHEEYSIA